MNLPARSTSADVRMPNFLTVCRIVLQVVAPLLLGLAAVLSCRWDTASVSIRWPLFFSFLLFGSLHFKTTFYVAILIAPWLTVPTLQFGIPNQFAFETALLGLLTAHALRKLLRPIHSPPGSHTWRLLLCHPFTLPSIFAISFTTLTTLISLNELYNYAHLKLSNVSMAKSFLGNLFLWDVSGPFHNLSIISGYLVLLSFFYLAIECRHQLRFSAANLAFTLCLGALPVYLASYGQLYLPLIFNQEFMVDIAGTFQNGNLLSFYAGLIIIQALILLNDKTQRMPFKIFACLVLFSSAQPLAYGFGRTTWIALTCSCILSLLIKGISSGRKGKTALSFLAVFSILTYTAFLSFEKISNHLLQTTDFTWDTVLFAGNRKHHYQHVVSFLQEEFITGLGLGNYFMHGDRKEIHNQYLQWAVELGLGSVLFLAIACFLFTRHSQLFSSFREHKFRGLPLASVLFIGLALMMDHYLTYRDIAFIVGCICLAILIPTHTSAFPSRRVTSGFIMLALGTGFAQALSTIAAPQTRPNLAMTYHHEQEGDRLFRWHAPLMNLSHPGPDTCVQLDLLAYHLAVQNTFRLGLICNELASDLQRLNISQIGKFERKLYYSKAIHIDTGRWQKITICVPASTYAKMAMPCKSGWRIYLRSDFGVYPEWTKDLAHSNDTRFLSFALSNIYELSLQEANLSKNIHKDTHRIDFH